MRQSPEFISLRRTAGTMLEAYRTQAWDKAEQAAESLLAQSSALYGLAQLYLGRIAEFRLYPPPSDWDGVYVATSK